MYKQASKLRLRFSSNKGNLTVEQLWDISLNDLRTIILNLHKKLKEINSSDLSFLDQPEQTLEQLAYSIAVDIYKSRQDEIKLSQEEILKKEQRNRILQIISEKENEDLRNKSIEELKAMLG